MAERIMTDEELMELHDDIRDGVSMIVGKEHYYEMEAKNERQEKIIKAFLAYNNLMKSLFAASGEK